ncbi:NAD(P)H-dependent flavin oxidoreductase [Donghicola sp. XS_ASV15]|uniref:NAD(P)H-dependent flavin oxidoreductase n=1 Tax=Donghicola sp. XS_ASV15 TaxID=3241295 RepID=UPI00351604DB
MTFLSDLGLSLPLIQAPMAGVATPQLAAAVSNAGALGSIGVGATDANGASQMIAALRDLTTAAFNVNLFVHKNPEPDPLIAQRWCAAMSAAFHQFEAQPPSDLQIIYQSFATDDAMLRVLLDHAPAVISFHFGLPDESRIKALKEAGSILFATATSLTEAQRAERAGIDAIVAQGYEAGGHRGLFDPSQPDERLGTEALTRLLVANLRCPVIAAGGLMNGADIRKALDWGAVAAQLGTAFVGCPESAADTGYRRALTQAAERGTIMTKALSGRPARCLVNRFTTWAQDQNATVPAYPMAYDAAKSLHAAAKAKGEFGFGAQWAGAGAGQARFMPAAELVATLTKEFQATGNAAPQTP